MSYKDSEDNVSRNRLDRFNIESLFVGVDFPQNNISSPNLSFLTEEYEIQLKK